MKWRTAWFQMKPETRGSGTITIGTVKIGDELKRADPDADGPDKEDEEEENFDLDPPKVPSL
jgi:hypothetical protein